MPQHVLVESTCGRVCLYNRYCYDSPLPGFRIHPEGEAHVMPAPLHPQALGVKILTCELLGDIQVIALLVSYPGDGGGQLHTLWRFGARD